MECKLLRRKRADVQVEAGVDGGGKLGRELGGMYRSKNRDRENLKTGQVLRENDVYSRPTNELTRVWCVRFEKERLRQ